MLKAVIILQAVEVKLIAVKVLLIDIISIFVDVKPLEDSKLSKYCAL